MTYRTNQPYLIIILSLIMGMVGLLAACQQTAPPLSEVAPTATAYHPQPTPVGVTIRVAGPNNRGWQGLKNQASEWEKLTGNRVEFITLPYEYLRQKTFVNLLNPSGGYDVVLIDDPWFTNLVSRGGVTPLADFDHQIDPDFVPISLQVCQWPPPIAPIPPNISPHETPKLYALPLIANVQLLWYRRDIITQPINTVDDLMLAAETQADPARGLYGYGYRGEGGNALATDFHAWNWSYGGSVFDNQWGVTINQPATVEALTRFQAMAAYAPANVNSWGSDDIQNGMLKGEVLTGLVWPSNNSGLTSAEMKARIGVMPFPPQTTAVSQLGHWLLTIAANSRHKEVAYNFVLWATSREIIYKLAQDGVPPPRLSVLRDPTLIEELWWLPVVEEALNQAKWRPRIPEWVQIEHVLAIAIEETLNKSKSPQQALDDAQKKIEEVMQKGGYRR